jgi:hypothetical protein
MEFLEKIHRAESEDCVVQRGLPLVTLAEREREK